MKYATGSQLVVRCTISTYSHHFLWCLGVILLSLHIESCGFFVCVQELSRALQALNSPRSPERQARQATKFLNSAAGPPATRTLRQILL